MSRRRFCLALDLVDDAERIADYERWHAPGGPPAAINASLRDSGIVDMEIYRAGARMFMILEVDETYSAQDKAVADAANPAVVEWGRRMLQYQRPVPAAGPDGSWIEMQRIYSLADQPFTD